MMSRARKRPTWSKDYDGEMYSLTIFFASVLLVRQGFSEDADIIAEFVLLQRTVGRSETRVLDELRAARCSGYDIP